MPLTATVLLLPCHSLDDFPVYHEGEDASELLSAWSALWHPALITATGKAPQWARADSPPEELAETLFIVPQVSEPMVPADWLARAEREALGFVRGEADRHVLVGKLVEYSATNAGQVDEELVADFLSLGTCYLLVELLTRQMRYMSNFDEASLGSTAVEGARAAVAGDGDKTRDCLRACFEILLEARERFYPVDCYLLDLTLVEQTTSGKRLVGELESGAAINVMVAGEVLARMGEVEPETLRALRSAVEAESASLVGGEATWSDLPLLPLEAVLWQFRRGARLYESLVGNRPSVWGRRRYGLSVGLPQLLSRLGYVAAVHGALDTGQFPRGEQAKIRWEGIDGSAIDAFARLPVDARLDESFLLFPARMGESMDLDHVATVMLAHWPGNASPFYEDLRRTSRYVPVLGRFVTLEDYFRHTDAPGRLTRFEADQYRTPYLREAVAAQQVDGLSRYARYLAARQKISAWRTMDAWTASLHGEVGRWDGLVEQVECGMPPATLAANATLWDELDRALQTSAVNLAERLGSSVANCDQTRDVLVLNPLSSARHVELELPDEAGCIARGEVPALGFAWLTAERPATTKRGRRFGRRVEPERHVLANRYVQVHVDEETGGIRSVHGVARYRGNRMSQQVAFRLPTPAARPGDVWRDPDETAVYSTMVADAVEDVGFDGLRPAVVSRGRLVHPDGDDLARFEQQVRLPGEGRIVQIDLRLEVLVPLESDPWDSYYAARFAWPDDDAEITRSVHDVAQPTSAKRVEAPLFVNVQMGQSLTTILTGGLPLHRRVGRRILDTLLHVPGETEQHFRLGIAVDAVNPTAAGWELVSPVVALFERASSSDGARAGWLFHLGSRNVVATDWELIASESGVKGLRIRLLETLGRSGRVALRCCRPVAVARQTDFQGHTLLELPCEGDAIHVDFAALEWVQLDVYWAD